MICLLSGLFSSCCETELPEMAGKDWGVMCEYDNTREAYHFVTSRLDAKEMEQVRRYGFILMIQRSQTGGDKESQMDFVEEVTASGRTADGGFEGWSEQGWMPQPGMYVAAYIETEYGVFQSTPIKF